MTHILSMGTWKEVPFVNKDFKKKSWRWWDGGIKQEEKGLMDMDNSVVIAGWKEA